jgi:FtsH-binding integral membrane protein
MDGISSLYNGGMGHFDMNVMLKMNSIDDRVQQHLCRVYSLLAWTVICGALGVWIFLKTGFELGFFGLMGIMGLIMYLSSTRNSYSSQTQTNRLVALTLFGIMKGLTLGSLVSLILMVDPSIIILAFLSTTAVFLSFSLAALLSKRRSYLYLGGILSSALSFFMLLSFLQIFMGYSKLMFDIHLYGGLMLFCGYVIFDTQVILEQAIMGDKDAVWHALQLFIDFVGIFVRICIILLKSAENKKSNSNRRSGTTSNR